MRRWSRCRYAIRAAAAPPRSRGKERTLSLMSFADLTALVRIRCLERSAATQDKASRFTMAISIIFMHGRPESARGGAVSYGHSCLMPAGCRRAGRFEVRHACFRRNGYGAR